MNREANKKWVILCDILIVTAFIIQFVNVKNIGQFTFISGFAFILNTLTLILAFVYLLKGYRKEDANLYKAFLIVYGIALLVTSSTIVGGAVALPIITRVLVPNYAMMYGILMVLACAENLGEQKALRFAYANLIMAALLLVALLILKPGTLRGGTAADSAIIINVAKNFVLALVLLVTTRSKYVDKAERGTK